MFNISDMAAESLSHYKDILIVLGTAGLIIPVLLRFGISTILGFLIVGIVLGPHVLGKFATILPSLGVFAISSPDTVAGLAELGVVFLLFLIGLELSPERLRTMRRLVFGLGGLQILISAIAITGVSMLAGFQPVQAAVIGMALSSSSTAIVIQLFSDEKRLGSQAGRISFAILLMQDLAVIPMLLLIGGLSGDGGSNVLAGMGWALLQAALAALAIVLVGRFVLTPVLRFVARTRSPDLFMAIVLFIAMGTGAAATTAGLSMSLGAFIAGLMLAETEYRRAIETTIEPFKGLLLGMFFLIVGLSLDVDMLLHSPVLVLVAAMGLIVLKASIILALGRIFKLPFRSTLEAALVLGPGGEFAFVLFTAAIGTGILDKSGAAPVLLIVTLGMMGIPLLARVARGLRTALRPKQSTTDMLRDLPADSAATKVIVAGCGRVGSVVAKMLDEQSIPYIAVDLDVSNVEAARRGGRQAFYGDATNLDFMRACGLATAKSLAITMDNPARVDEILRLVRLERPDIKIIARARDERHAQRLYKGGATEAVPETIEASLQLGEALLVETGVPMGLAIASVHELRDSYRKLLGQPNRREELAKARKRLRTNLKN